MDTQPDDVEAAKRRAGTAAADAVEDGMTVGLGTGSTAAHAIRALGRAVDAGLDVRGVPTSYQSRERAREAGVPLVGLDEVDRIDLAIDGADQVAADGAYLIKGGGAAHAREKVIDAAAERLLVVVDPTKLVDRLDGAVPVEVLPAARTAVRRRLEALDGAVTLRAAAHKSGPVVTDNGNLVLDCAFGPIEAPAELGATLAGIPGVLEHGLFVELTDRVYVGTDEGVRTLQPGAGAAG